MEPSTADTLIQHGAGSLFRALLGATRHVCFCANPSCAGLSYPSCAGGFGQHFRDYVVALPFEARAAASALNAVRITEGAENRFSPALLSAGAVPVRIPASAEEHARREGELTWWLPLDTNSVTNVLSERADAPVHAVMVSKWSSVLPPLVWGTIGMLEPAPKGELPRLSLDWLRQAWCGTVPPLPEWIRQRREEQEELQRRRPRRNNNGQRARTTRQSRRQNNSMTIK